MFFKQKSNVLFRNYNTFGYITDNRNFGYEKVNNIGDKIISQSGAIFFSILKKEPQEINVLARRISSIFPDVDIDDIKNDAIEFYSMLEKEGFITSGSTLEECNEKDIGFSYEHPEDFRGKRRFSPENIHPNKSTQDFFEEIFKNKPQLTSLHIEITSKCNERCVHCYIPHDNKMKNIESDLFYDILNQCYDMNVLHLTLSGGEPLLHKCFCDFLKKCREYDFSVNILSNLTLLDDTYIEEMKKNRLLGVQVSLYSMKPDVHDKITKMKGSFEKTKRSILKLVENNIPLQISCPIMEQNKNCYLDVIEWAKEYNIPVGEDYALIARYDHNTENLDNRLSVNDIKNIINNRINCDDEYLKDIINKAEEKKEITSDDIVCSICYSSICISENGSVYPCAGWQDYTVGNIKENSLKEIWYNSKKVQYLRGLRKKDFPKCIQCGEKEFCTMCMVRNANENSQGDPLVVNEYFCNIAKLNKSIVLSNEKKS
ncbi:radical SAM/SPASM domain-containing protein [Vibrio rhizosphaerae]|uniref:radical SAM/SPASM domain-containing protein n=1 Tax=Vibrio rhizosphaerae TaxID=398736 RepID=UPI00056E5E62|nr:radical SAM protein [Vibrio rhizosphaerae]